MLNIKYIYIFNPVMTELTKYLYKRTVDPVYWQKYLSRKLTTEEKFILSDSKSEQKINNEIKEIYARAQQDGLYIPVLTDMKGNCLFESLQILGLFEDFNLFRSGLAQILLILKNVPDFLPNIHEPLGEMFPNFNEVEFVKCGKTKKLYKYNYDAMCVDLAKDTNWTRLNTEMILRIICVLLNINVVIYHFKNKNAPDDLNPITRNLNLNPNEDTLTFHLGQTDDEFHYFPLKREENLESRHPCVVYNVKLTEYHAWARSMASSLGMVDKIVV
jgi:hypothetical protein